MDTNNNQTDIFGNVTSFVQEPTPVTPAPVTPKPEVVPMQRVENVVPTSMNMGMNAMPIPPVEPVDPVEVISIPEDEFIPEQNKEVPMESFTEMPFAGVNQQVDGKTVSASVSSEPVHMIEEDKNPNMEPVMRNDDENAGLKFLLVLGIIFAVTIILLPVLA